MTLTPKAVHGDWPDYSLAPQMDHYWEFSNSFVDAPGSGKTEYDLQFDGSGNWTWQSDWAGRATQAIQADGVINGLYYPSSVPDLCDLGATFTVFMEFYVSTFAQQGHILLTTDGGSDGFDVSIVNTYLFYVWNYADSSHPPPVQLAQNTNCQIIFTQSAGTMTVYLNGAFASSGAFTAPLPNPGYFRVGGNSSASQSPPPAGFKYYRVGVLKGTAYSSTQVQNVYNTWVPCGGNRYARYPDNPQFASDSTCIWYDPTGGPTMQYGQQPQGICGGPPIIV